MPEKISLRKDSRVIQVDSYGAITAPELYQSLEKVLELRRETGFSKILVDASKETSFPTTFPAFEFGSELADRFRGTKFALVISPSTREELAFLETVIVNRGGIIRSFPTSESALEWLKSQP